MALAWCAFFGVRSVSAAKVVVTTVAVLALAWCAYFGVRSVSVMKAVSAFIGGVIMVIFCVPRAMTFGFRSDGH